MNAQEITEEMAEVAGLRAVWVTRRRNRRQALLAGPPFATVASRIVFLRARLFRRKVESTPAQLGIRLPSTTTVQPARGRSERGGIVVSMGLPSPGLATTSLCSWRHRIRHTRCSRFALCAHVAHAIEQEAYHGRT